ncbi:MAG: winged helix-turn-helix domain-containing protein [Prevotellaceae bacterium]|nr:winged helix-turn-helix domain-containing protein [Prevotellaceae bacterium]
MLQEKAGNIAGLIWNALAEANTSLTFKQIKKTTKLAEKDFNLGIGWLLREDKLTVAETGDEKDPYAYSLK